MKEDINLIDAIVKLNCPACNSSDFTAVGTASNEFKVYGKAGQVFTHPAFMVNKCNNCILYFKSSIPGYDTLNKYYENLDNTYEDLDFLFPTDIITIKEINRSGHGIKVLDYGCGTGRILNQLSGEVEKYGTELNEESIIIAQKRNIKIIHEVSLKEYVNFFDVIILTDVYEHLYKPMELITILKNCIKPNGKMIIVTGNSEAITQKKIISGYWYFQLFSHLQMLNISHVKWMSEKLNLHIEKLIESSHYDTSYIIKLKHKLAIYLFAIYNKMPGLRIWESEKWKFIKTWKYPSFDYSNKDHLVIVLKKNQ